MILAAYQPVYFPSASFFYKMSQADIFLLADDLHFVTHSNFNRTHIKTEKGQSWLTVPTLTTGRGPQKINSVQIAKEQNWQWKHLKTLELNYKNAPYFDLYRDEVVEILTGDWEYLVDLNLRTIEFLQKHLFNKTRRLLLSTFPGVKRTNERIIEIMKLKQCEVYLAESVHRPFIEENLFEEAGLRVRFLDFKPLEYHQQFTRFIPNLSALDLIFNEGGSSFQFLVPDK